jgi:hypothetical protein
MPAKPPPLRAGENVTGNGSASPGDLIIAQDAILAALAASTASQTLLRRDMGRELKAIRSTVSTVSCQLNGVCDEVVTIKTERRIEAALAVERTANAEKAAKAEADHAATARDERHDMAAKTDAHTLSLRWRVGIAVGVGISAFSQIVPLAEKLAGIR